MLATSGIAGSISKQALGLSTRDETAFKMGASASGYNQSVFQ